MTKLNDVRDIVRGAVASFFGFGGRLIARALLMVLAGRAFGIEALGVLGQVAAITEIAAAIGVIGLKRGLLDILSHDAKNARRLEPRIVEALLIAGLFGCMISALLLFVWPHVLPGDSGLTPILFMAIPAIVLTEVALTAIKYKRIIRWDVWTRGIVEPWGFLGLAAALYYSATGANGLVLAYAGSIFLGAACAGIGLLNTFGFSLFVREPIALSNWRAIATRSIAVGITDVGIMMLRRVDLIVLSFFVGPQGAGLYYMVQQFATIPQKVNALFEPMMSPVIARLHHVMDASSIRSNLVGVCRWIFILQLAITVPMVVFGDYLLSVFGPEFVAGGTVLAIVLLAELIDGSFVSVETPLIFAHPKIPPALIFATIIVEMVMIALLSSVWGVVGAAAGFLIAITCLAVGRLVMAKARLGIGVIDAGYLAPAAFAIVTSIGLVLARRWIEPHQTALIIFCFVVAVAAFIFLIKTFAMTKSDQIMLRALMRRRQGAPAS